MIKLDNINIYAKIQELNDLFDPSEALASGTLFKDLDLNYKYSNPKNKNYMNKKDNILGLIYEYDFALLELGLFLDTHKNDKKAMELFSNYNSELKKLKLYYEKNYALLCKESIFNTNIPYSWINDPWPWEK